MEISVIIPVYNTEKYIAKCLECVLKQTFQDFEIIVVNDCTPDNAMQIVQFYADKDSRIRIVNHKTNRGLMVARRSGYDVALGNYIMFLDSDDTLPLNAMELLYNNAIQTNADIVIGGMHLVDSNDKIIHPRLPKITGTFDSKKSFDLLFKRQIYHNLCAAAFKRVLFNHEFYTLENQTNGEDLILFYQLLSKSRTIAIIKDSVYNYLQNEMSSTHTNVSNGKLDQYFNIQYFKYNFLIEQGFPKDQVINFIIPVLIEWFYYPHGRKLITHLPKDIQEALKVNNIFHHLSFAQASLAIIIRKMPFIIPLINNIKSYIHRIKSH